MNVKPLKIITDDDSDSEVSETELEVIESMLKEGDTPSEKITDQKNMPQKKRNNQHVVSDKVGLSCDEFGVVVLAGKSNSGKSNLMLNILLQNYNRWNEIYLSSTTFEQQPLWVNIVDKSHIIPPDKDSLQSGLESIIQDQSKNINNKICFILDDLVGSVSFRHSDLFDKIAATCRHHRLTVFFIVQDLKKLSTCIRQNTTSIFCTLLFDTSLDALYDIFGGRQNRKSFKEFMVDNMRDYRVIKFNLNSGYDLKKQIEIFVPKRITTRYHFRSRK
jgi:energy-coupling factor transporter ATP-binding protein EcfA2